MELNSEAVVGRVLMTENGPAGGTAGVSGVSTWGRMLCRIVMRERPHSILFAWFSL